VRSYSSDSKQRQEGLGDRSLDITQASGSVAGRSLLSTRNAEQSVRTSLDLSNDIGQSGIAQPPRQRQRDSLDFTVSLFMQRVSGISASDRSHHCDH
jgi:hypothetical protein